MNIPKLGLGTWKIDNDQITQVIPLAYDIGYRLFDTAWIYGNEKGLGESFIGLNVSRSDYWITTKVWFDFVPNYQKHTFVEKDFMYTELDQRLENSFKDLKTEYFDLVFLHWPTTLDNDVRAFEKLLNYKKEGRIRYLGVSNFPKNYLEKMVSYFGDEIAYCQFERHAFLANDVLENYLEENSIYAMAYSPLGHQHLLKNEELLSISSSLDIGVPQLCLSYLLKKGFVVIPKAISEEHLKENYEALDIKLSDDIIKRMDGLPKNYRYNNPPFAPKWD